MRRDVQADQPTGIAINRVGQRKRKTQRRSRVCAPSQGPFAARLFGRQLETHQGRCDDVVDLLAAQGAPGSVAAELFTHMGRKRTIIAARTALAKCRSENWRRWSAEMRIILRSQLRTLTNKGANRREYRAISQPQISLLSINDLLAERKGFEPRIQSFDRPRSVIEPGLQPPSRSNGNISNIRRKLSAFSR